MEPRDFTLFLSVLSALAINGNLIIPSVDELNVAELFLKLDLRARYYQI